MNSLQPDPKTGFLESRNPSLEGFTALKKVKFLELANEIAGTGNYPDIQTLCKAVGISPRTFYDHTKEDARFKEGWELALRRIENELIKVMVVNGQRPSGYMDRITWLRRHFPEWNPENKVQITRDNAHDKKLIEGISDAIDAEIVESPTDKE